MISSPERAGVLITRPQSLAEQTAREVQALGYRPVIAPLFSVQPLQAALPVAETLQAVLITSGHALAALPPAYRGLPLLAVGNATAARAKRQGHRHVESAEGDAESLAALAARRCDPNGLPLLLPTGEGYGEALEQALSAKGFRVIRVAVYAVRPVPSLPESAREALAENTLKAALFFSPETARIFVRLIHSEASAAMLTQVEALAISAKVAEELALLPWRRVRVSSHPTQAALLGLLA
ncbi:MAG: uroporphyrinogen-III synthase [Acidobacteriia bacterium]|nr:uroporphyrinogen-III synthase [Methyloceanibacter sp.]MCL6490520.1 uroporphyrinogen-III synthase [Terriglobia bacterium]